MFACEGVPPAPAPAPDDANAAPAEDDAEAGEDFSWEGDEDIADDEGEAAEEWVGEGAALGGVELLTLQHPQQQQQPLLLLPSELPAGGGGGARGGDPPIPIPIPVLADCQALGNESACAGEAGCVWCVSAAVPSSCYTEAEARRLPGAVFRCKFPSWEGAAAR